MAGIDAGAHGNVVAQVINDFGDLLKTAAQRILRSGGVFNQDGQSPFREIQSVACRRDGCGGLQQSLFAVGSAK